MAYRIVLEGDVLRAELSDRHSPEEMRAFLRAVVRDSARIGRILIHVRTSRPIFQVEREGLIDQFRAIAGGREHRIALVADNAPEHAAHEYLELIARQRGVNVRSFRSEFQALLWLRERRDRADRRSGEDRRGDERPHEPERRHNGERRAPDS